MNLSILIVPLLAIAFGLLGYFGFSNDKNKQAQVALCLFFCGLFLLLWILTFRGVHGLG
jgi:hypothetical protein